MIKVYLANDSSQETGGGWTFLRNIAKGLTKLGHQVVDKIEDCDIVLISGVTMVKRETVDRAKELDKKIVTRCDNVPRNSRNRNCGTSRLQEFARRADEVVWQCQWAKDYLIDFIGREGKILYNGVDTDIFRPQGQTFDFGDKDLVYLYSRFNRDENKRWELAWYKFQLLFRENKNRRLILVGQFSPEQQECSFDFFRGEKVDYLGIIDEPEQMARVYRSCGYLLATYAHDCYSNTYQEFLATGGQLYEPDMSGGTPELIKNGVITLEQMAKEYEKVFIEVLNR